MRRPTIQTNDIRSSGGNSGDPSQGIVPSSYRTVGRSSTPQVGGPGLELWSYHSSCASSFTLWSLSSPSKKKKKRAHKTLIQWEWRLTVALAPITQCTGKSLTKSHLTTALFILLLLWQTENLDDKRQKSGRRHIISGCLLETHKSLLPSGSQRRLRGPGNPWPLSPVTAHPPPLVLPAQAEGGGVSRTMRQCIRISMPSVTMLAVFFC